jgi:outer membrane protein assembly factor BamE (lipoprotein component of BamABCDE complex)
MGTPTTTSTVGGSAWYYISQRTNRTLAFSQPAITDQRVMAVYFDRNKKVERVANYGVEDGKIIDFITRTTPTSGAEQSFLQNAMKNLLRMPG